MMESVLFTRQPIFDTSLNTYAYQLLYDGGEGCDTCVNNKGAHTADILVNAYSNILESGYVRYLPALIACDVDWLLEGSLPEVPVDTLVLDIYNYDRLSTEAKTSLQAVASEGYRIVASCDDAPELINIASIIKIDVRNITEDELATLCRDLKGKILLADSVETHAEYDRCKALGFDLFIGRFFAAPQFVKGRRLERNEQVMFQLIGEVNQPSATPESIEKVLQSDPELVTSLLKLVNSAAFRGRRTISSITEAIVLLGLNELRKWVLMFALCHNKRKSNELITLLLVKGKMCELLASENAKVDPSTAFLTGILSGIDAVLSMPLDVLLQQMPVQVEVKRALSGGINPLGKVLATVNAYILGDWDSDSLLDNSQRERLPGYFRTSIEWAEGVLQQLD